MPSRPPTVPSRLPLSPTCFNPFGAGQSQADELESHCGQNLHWFRSGVRSAEPVGESVDVCGILIGQLAVVDDDDVLRVLRGAVREVVTDRKSTRLNSSHIPL